MSSATVDGMHRPTYIIFVGDNGTPMYGRPKLDFIDNMYITRTARGKGTAYEGGALVPLVVRGPGIAADTRERRVHRRGRPLPDHPPACRARVPEQVSAGPGGGQIPLAGKSLLPILQGKADAVRDPDRDYIITESTNLMTENTKVVGIRNGHYKLVCTDQADNCEFYDIVADRLEQYPLPHPASCASASRWSPADREWHFCHLQEAVKTRTMLG